MQDLHREVDHLTNRTTTWNPFNDMQPFSQMSEDHIFGAEFDRIRRGSQSSKYLDYFHIH